MPAEHTRGVWIPDIKGSGRYDLNVLRVAKAVKEYDEALDFGRNTETGQWCIYLQRRGHDALPVLGFTELPHPEDAVRRLSQADALRRGDEILREMNAYNEEVERIQNEPLDRQADIAADELAQRIEHIRRTTGKTRYAKSFRVKSNRMGGYS